MTDPSSPANECIKWATSHGALIEQLHVQEIPGRGNSLVASAHNGNGQSIFIPTNLLLTLKNIELFATQTPAFQAILHEWSARVKLTSRRAIIILMAYTAVHGSPWSPYLNSLPDHVSSPLFWSGQERRLLDGTSIEGVAEDKMAFLEAWLQYQKRRQNASEFTLGLELKDLMKYEMLVDSRALLSNEDDSCMVPVIDFANHSSLKPGQTGSQNAVWEMDDTGFHLSTLYDIAPGEEVLFSYGKRGNGELLFKYGFVEEHQVEGGSRSMTIELPIDETQAAHLNFGEPSFTIAPEIADDPLFVQDSWFLWMNVLLEENDTDWSTSKFRGAAIGRDMLQRLQTQDDWPWFHFKACSIALSCLTRQRQRLDQTEEDTELIAIAKAVGAEVLAAVDAVRDSERVTLDLNIEKMQKLQIRLLEDPIVQHRAALCKP
ncbi:protein of unknown function [Taphrina deformans PYCC 5710]|uniref:SET domain-containing protein n=1 Tax=Taphrina deformans (strain PYCC 5710 / ATCC 11124 / CBS 356.35 / IMI 108563 / JCM 9778 / NBRC 8474) TaxID=1097556 RepID=R4XG95_TAPDE|nr:protein of unknown function [Taphrina deformans PYCC 5710]|eukprot:CCG84647.1 protein of unknown function [Taphrina deformans PYCC 5710]